MSSDRQAIVEPEIVLVFPSVGRHAFLLDGRELPDTAANARQLENPRTVRDLG